MKPISRLSLLAKHRNCTRQISAYWEILHKGDALGKLLYRAMMSTFEVDLDQAIANFKLKCPKGYKDFIKQALSNSVGFRQDRYQPLMWLIITLVRPSMYTFHYQEKKLYLRCLK